MHGGVPVSVGGWALACELNLSIEQDKAIYRLARDEEMKSEE